jgi:hypothetical protein
MIDPEPAKFRTERCCIARAHRFWVGQITTVTAALAIMPLHRFRGGRPDLLGHWWVRAQIPCRVKSGRRLAPFTSTVAQVVFEA